MSRISPQALGLSYETSCLLVGSDGVRYFRADNAPLVRLFKTLGIASLRIGGNSVDQGSALPEDQDIVSLFEFARAANVMVIYSVRLKDGDPRAAAHVAELIRQRFADRIECYSIGNEPSYYKDYEIYRARWTAIRDAMVAADPQARFCAPDENPSPELSARIIREFGNEAGRLVQLSHHSYPFGCSYRNPKEKDPTRLVPFDAAESREKMLQPSAYELYQKIHDQTARLVQGTSLTFRLTETNSYWYSGLKGASDSYASALWAADYLYWWISHGAVGLNFHTGDRTGGAITLPARYAVFVSSPRGYEVRPLAYGLKLFDLGGHGTLVPAQVRSSPHQNLAAYATLGDDNSLAITLINKTHGPGADPIQVRIRLDAPLADAQAQAIELRSTNNDIAADASDLTLGGAAIHPDGTWNGTWSELPKSAISGDAITVPMLPASGMVIKTRVR
ncbi:hypothetical protein [Fontivita pretiosa]|uniref:hypothetical protein n=1 Tax=Fontivita pretiosa TaxID=2989684 RepID=UPI003D17A00F